MRIKIKERTIVITYGPLIIESWNNQTEEFKSICDQIGKPYGYSGMNVFYFFFLLYALVIYGDMELRPFWKSKDSSPPLYAA